tara:strand:- start:10865 stop:11113 length:249 start_codon:yes stop_codon:yes gene_type:complete
VELDNTDVMLPLITLELVMIAKRQPIALAISICNHAPNQPMDIVCPVCQELLKIAPLASIYPGVAVTTQELVSTAKFVLTLV